VRTIYNKMNKNLQQLQKDFPQFPADLLQQILIASNGNLKLAHDEITAMLSNDPIKELPKDIQNRSMVVPYDEYGSSCGYCGDKLKKGRISFGMDSVRLTCEDYQALIDRGWRRSGNWLYKPTNKKACCPNYTIRLDVTKFEISASQKKVKRKVERYFAGQYDNEEKGEKDKQQQPQQQQPTSNTTTTIVKRRNSIEKSPLLLKLYNLIYSSFLNMLKANQIIQYFNEKTLEEQLSFMVAPNKQRKFGDVFTNITLSFMSLLKKSNLTGKIFDGLKPTDISNTIISYMPLKQDQQIEIEGVGLSKLEVAPNGFINFFYHLVF